MPDFLSIKSFSIYFVFSHWTGYGGYKFPDFFREERLVFCCYDTYFPVTVIIFSDRNCHFPFGKTGF